MRYQVSFEGFNIRQVCIVSLQEYWVPCSFQSVTVETVHQALALSTGRHALIKLGS
jgi:hypothetical protein